MKRLILSIMLLASGGILAGCTQNADVNVTGTGTIQQSGSSMSGATFVNASGAVVYSGDIKDNTQDAGVSRTMTTVMYSIVDNGSMVRQKAQELFTIQTARLHTSVTGITASLTGLVHGTISTVRSLTKDGSITVTQKEQGGSLIGVETYCTKAG